MKKIIAILFVFTLCFGVLAACQKDEPAGASDVTTLADPAPSETESTSETETESTSETQSEPASETEPETDDSGNTVTTAIDPTDPAEPTASSAGGAVTKAQAVKLYANTVSKVLAANKNIKKHTKTVINRPFDCDADTKKLIDINILNIYHVETVVAEDLFGEGEQTYNQPAKDGLQPSYLTEADVTGFTAKQLANGNTELVLNIKNCSNPNKTHRKQGSSPLGNFTWDYVNLQSIQDGIKSAEETVPGLKINLTMKGVNYSNIQIKAVIKPDGTFASLVHSFNFNARAENLEVKLAVVKLGGGKYIQGTAKSSITYTF